MEISLPESIRKELRSENGTPDRIGRSSAHVFLFSDRVLKIQPDGEEAQNEVRMLRWLGEKSPRSVPVPEVLAYEVQDGRSFLLMSRCPGKMACDRSSMQDPSGLCAVLAQSLQLLWRTDIRDCPSDRSLDRMLETAERNVELGLISTENAHPGVFGKGGFSGPRALLDWLRGNRPEETGKVLSHGDFSLPNIFLSENRISGLVNLGRMGVCDRWYDISVCCRSLVQNFRGKYRSAAYDGFDERALFRELGLPFDREIIRYCLLLEELL